MESMCRCPKVETRIYLSKNFFMSRLSHCWILLSQALCGYTSMITQRQMLPHTNRSTFFYFYCICKFLFFGLSKTLYQIIISTINFDALFKFQNLLHIPLTPLCSFYLVHWHCLLKHRRLWTNQKKGC